MRYGGENEGGIREVMRGKFIREEKWSQGLGGRNDGGKKRK